MLLSRLIFKTPDVLLASPLLLLVVLVLLLMLLVPGPLFTKYALAIGGDLSTCCQMLENECDPGQSSWLSQEFCFRCDKLHKCVE